ncbi:putative DNA damage checkpoint control protein RAD17 [[Candida] jaroonii]|uniref:DNA damage checkpoint control protein RAD17 n=1 Tax=[Candida] jaroonii TaxID=467808 RepID=A0ACA9Y9P3_9ASCO|nr:putative DNA damage checkpoint control protein RAD17 [[Candida] jaroonii]
MNGQAIIDASLFNTFNIVEGNTQNDKEIRFGIDLNLINYAFDNLSASTVCYLSYNGEGSPFIIEFEDNIMSESIEFLTFYLDLTYPYDDIDNDDEGFDLVVDYNELQYELILKSDVFENLLSDLININTQTVYIYLSNYFKNELSFISLGPIGHSKLIYPSERNILEKLEIHSKESNVVSSFKFQNFIKIFKSVKLSNKCKITKGLNGVFALQLICKDSNNNNYVGTLITINMLEIDSDLDISNLNIFDEVEVPVKRRKVNEIEVPLFL